MKHLVIATLHVIALWPVTLSQNRILGLNSMSNTHQMGHAHSLFIVTWLMRRGSLKKGCVQMIFILSNQSLLCWLFILAAIAHCH